MGSSPTASAEHLGTSPNSLDTSSGLLSALGGADVHAMSFAGSEIMPAENAGGHGRCRWRSRSSRARSRRTGCRIRRGSATGGTRRGSRRGPAAAARSTSSTGTPFAGNAPTMDSGMSDGGKRRGADPAGELPDRRQREPELDAAGADVEGDADSWPGQPRGGPLRRWAQPKRFERHESGRQDRQRIWITG